MENNVDVNLAEHISIRADVSQSSIDKWDRASNITLSLLQRTSQLEAFVAEQKNKEWKSKTSIPSIFIPTSIEIPLKIKNAFEKLEHDFFDFSNRIVWCDELKNCLSKFEEDLEEYDAKYLSWFVSTLKDAFSYNYAETITEQQLDLLKNGIETIYAKQGNCDKDSFADYHLQLVESGLSLLPTTQKAIDEFGE